MQKILALTAAAAVLALGGPALAQAPPAKATAAKPAQTTTTTTTTAPAASAAATTATTTAAPASGPDAAANAGASATVMSGMSVKDNTGALIGEVKSVKGAVATIAMGTDTFNVETDKLGVKDGVASINATQAELKKMLPAKK